ncbi:GIY-YIG nuclease family protein [Streptomyces canus]|uniref:GIY-YIG nuclease family protein n=1 Tax=Streptomyces canus TaxID=58343 RepID=UPI0033D7263B
MQDRTAVYRLYDARESLLYVGITRNIKERWQSHELIQRWWHLVARRDVSWLASRDAALEAEARAVENEGPLYNAKRLSDGSYQRTEYDHGADVELAAEAMRRELANGTLSAGMPIHLVKLARRYGVSAISVMVAMKQLPSNAIIERGNKRFVADPDHQQPAPRAQTLRVLPHDWFEAHGFPG